MKPFVFGFVDVACCLKVRERKEVAAEKEEILIVRSCSTDLGTSVRSST